ncbi:MAG: efflux RND transporter permease subunit, partial [Hyphomicrobiales bacterium]
VTRVRSDLPASVEEPIVQRLDVTGLPIVTYSVTDPNRTIAELSHFVDDDVARELQGLNSVGDVRRVGGIDEQINVDLDPARLASLGITAAEVSQQLSATNINLGSGRGDLGSREFSIRALGSSLSVADLAALPIVSSEGRSVRLDQIGRINDGGAEIRSYASFDGEPIVAFQILRSTGGSDTEAADSAYAAVEKLKGLYPEVTFAKIDDVSVYTRGNYEQTMDTLFEGAALAVVVVFLFLRDWRATLIAGVALPLSVIPTFFMMWVLDFSLNGISLLAVTLVTGILVDDAIVEIENIERHMAMGKSPYKASMEAADEIGLTVVAISSTIVAVFAPVSFMSGIAGQYFRQFGLTVAIAVLFSLAVARFLTPMMTAYFLKDRGHGQRPDGFVMRNYLRILRWTLRWRWITLGLGLAFFAVSIWSATLLPTGFLPEEDNGRSALSVELPPGSQVEDNMRVTSAIAEKLQAIPEVADVLITGGNGPGGGSVADPTQAVISLYYVPKAERSLGKYQIEAKIEDAIAGIPDIRTYFANDGGQRAIVLSILGEDQGKVDAYARDLVDAIAALGSVKNVTSGASLMRPEIQITPKGDVAAELGVTANAIAETIRVATIGDVEARLAKFNRGDRQVPIMVRLNDDARRDLSNLSNQMVPRTGGILVVRSGGTKEALEDLLKADPFQINGLAHYQVTEFKAGKLNPALVQFA